MAGEIEVRHHEACDNVADHPDGKPFPMELEILQSSAGYYLGTECDYCGPYGRESGYFRTYEEALAAKQEWDAGNKVGARDTDFLQGEIIVHHFDTSEEFEEFTKRYFAGQDDEP